MIDSSRYLYCTKVNHTVLLFKKKSSKMAKKYDKISDMPFDQKSPLRSVVSTMFCKAKSAKKTFFSFGDFRPLHNKNVQIWDHVFPLIFPTWVVHLVDVHLGNVQLSDVKRGSVHRGGSALVVSTWLVFTWMMFLWVMSTWSFPPRLCPPGFCQPEWCFPRSTLVMSTLPTKLAWNSVNNF